MLPIKAMLPFRKMFTLRHTNLLPYTGLLLLSGALSLRSRLKALHRQLLELQAGTVRWLRLGIQACHPSRSTHTSSVKVFAHQPSMPLSAQ